MGGVRTAAAALACALFAASCNTNLTTALQEKIARSEKEPPVPGGAGVLATGTPRAGAIPLSWEKASDGFTGQADLEYRLVHSVSDNVRTLDGALANGIVSLDWTADLASADVEGLAVLTTYFLNVLVRDRAGNMAAYAGGSATTTNDTTPPTPGPPTTLTIDAATMDHFRVSWTRGTDSIAPVSALTYQVYLSKTTNLASPPMTAAQVISNGTAWGTPAADIATLDLTAGMDDNVLYYVNVIIRDENNNAAAYAGASATYPKHPRFFWSERTAHMIRKADLDGSASSAVDVYDTGASTQPTAIALDPAARLVYYAAQGAGYQTISAVGFDGTGRVDLVSSGLGAPRGIALDIPHGYVYWTDATNDGIYRALLTTRNAAAPSPIVSLTDVNPNGIAVDPAGGLIYWAEESSGLIRKANLDGSGAATVNSANCLNPLDLCLAGGMLWITDRNAARPMVCKMNTAGTGWVDVIENLTYSSPRGIAVDTTNGSGYFYWTQSYTGIHSLHRAPVGTTGGDSTLFKLSGIDESGLTPIGIAVY